MIYLSVWDDVNVVEKDKGECNKYHQMDVIWGYRSTMEAVDLQLMFMNLFKVVKFMLMLSYPTVGEKKEYLMVQKNKTLFNSSVSVTRKVSITNYKSGYEV